MLLRIYRNYKKPPVILRTAHVAMTISLTEPPHSVSDIQKVVLASSSLEIPVQTQQALELSAPADLDKTRTELADWLVLIDQMLKSNIVTVGNTEEINRTIARMKVCVFVKASRKLSHILIVLTFTKEIKSNSMLKGEKMLTATKCVT